MEWIYPLVVEFAKLAGVAALVAAVVNVFKAFGAVKDGTSGTWFAALNLLAMAGLISVKVFRPDILTADLDAYAAKIAIMLTVVLGYVVQLGVGKWAHGNMSRMNIFVLGTSLTKKESGAPSPDPISGNIPSIPVAGMVKPR
jgi:hypothetical protein